MYVFLSEFFLDPFSELSASIWCVIVGLGGCASPWTRHTRIPRYVTFPPRKVYPRRELCHLVPVPWVHSQHWTLWPQGTVSKMCSKAYFVCSILIGNIRGSLLLIKCEKACVKQVFWLAEPRGVFISHMCILEFPFGKFWTVVPHLWECRNLRINVGTCSVLYSSWWRI